MGLPETTGFGLTPDTAATSYLAPTEFLNFADSSFVGRIINDDGSLTSVANLATNAVLLECLNAASGELESACLAADRYGPADLQALTGVSQAFLKKLVAALTVKNLIDRRMDASMKYPPAVDTAVDTLYKLRAGDQIFSFQETEDSGGIDEVKLAAQDLQQQCLLSRYCHRVYGILISDYPITR